MPVGSGPATTARREAIWAQVSAKRATSGQAPLNAMEQGLRYVQELENALPAGSKPLVMHAFQLATNVSHEFSHFATEERVENGEVFRLTLIAMRQYLELYALVCGGRGVTYGASSHRVRPVAVTIDEFERALPLLKQWGVRVGDPETTFARLDKSGTGVVKFDDFCHWVMHTQMESLSAAVLFHRPSPSQISGGPGGSRPGLTPPPAAPGGAGAASRLHPTHGLAFGQTDRTAVGLSLERRGKRASPTAGLLVGRPRSATSHHALPHGGRQRGVTAWTHPGSAVPVKPRATKFDLAERLTEVHGGGCRMHACTPRRRVPSVRVSSAAS